MEFKIALAGNPNSGKTTLFNNLTGSTQYVGNWPGVTVEKKDGKLKGSTDVIVQDLPGIYSLSPYTQEEVVTRKYLVNQRPDVVLNIVDATNIERNLYLTTQLIELGIPVVIALNMIDIVRKNEDQIDIDLLGKKLGCKVIEISALRGEGCIEAAQLAIDTAKEQKIRVLPHVYNGSVEHALAHIEESLMDRVDERLVRWYAIKVFERDQEIIKELKLEDSLIDHLEEHIVDCEVEMEDEAESIITDQRYRYITEATAAAVIKKPLKNGLTISGKIDSIVTNKYLALPIFAVVMFLVYFVSVTTVGSIVTDFTNETLFGEWIMPTVASGLERFGASDWVISLVVDGIIGGISAPIGFAPQMAILFLFLSFLEDCGYMSRVAFIMDRAFRRFGLSGKSFIPLLISSGCGVPGIMAARTIESEKNRRMTMITTTMIPCGAKLPVIALIAGAIMGGAWWMAPAMYFMGIGATIISCLILKKFKMFAGEDTPFVMELPAYHMPSAKSIAIHVWDRVWSFLKKAGTILFLCCAVMWFLSSFGFEQGSFGLVDAEHSLVAVIGNVIAPIFAPLGFGTWQSVAATLSGFVAKEGIVTTMGVLVGSGGVMTMFASSAAAMAFLVFNLLDSPCLAAITTLGKEMGSKKWTTFALVYQNVFAYAVTLMVYQFGALFTGAEAFGAGTVTALIVLGLMFYLLVRKGHQANKIGGTAYGTHHE
ncbi:ferrous iron transport protein B [Clostridiales Family XIII bacterium PM5-7]